MNRAIVVLLALCAARPALAADAATGGTAGKTSIVILEELHWTSDALDSILVLPDRYRRVAVRLAHQGALGDATLELEAHAEETRFKRYSIEDDREAGASATVSGAVKRTELRGTLAWGWSDEGDDLPLAFEDGSLAAIGLRTATQTLFGGAEAGIDLGGGLALVAAASAKRSFVGDTEFEAGLLPALRLEPDRRDLAFSLAVKRAGERREWSLAAGLRTVEAIGPGNVAVLVPSRLVSLLAGIDVAPAGTVKAGIAGGVETLRSSDGIFESTRPALRATLAWQATPALTLSALLAAFHETDDTDDPLASWLQRAEVEVAIAAKRELLFGIGAFAERREEIALGWRRRSFGAYGEASWRVASTLALTLRADMERLRSPLFPGGKTRSTVFLSAKAEL